MQKRTRSARRGKCGRAGIDAVLVDTSPRPATRVKLAREMGARYLPLPHADAATLSKAVLAGVS